MFIDTHAHLTDKKILNDLPEILKACEAASVKKLISIGCTLKEAEESIELAQKHKQIFATAGLYPHDNQIEQHLSIAERLNRLEKLLTHEKIVAVGECGLDFKIPGEHEIKREVKVQIELFEAQFALAKKMNLPLIIHSREATKETLAIIKNHKNTPKVWHCFIDNYETAKKVLALNCFISFTGIITYPKNLELRETVKKIPLERIMIETDSPYLLPQAARDAGVKTNNPSYVKMIAQEISSIKNINLDLIEEETSKNATKFFHI